MDKKHLDLARTLGAKIAVPVTFPVVVEGNVLHFPIAKRQAPVGTVHQWGDGHKYRKTPTGWEMVHDTGGSDPGHPTTDKPAPEKAPAPAPAHVVVPAPATPPPPKEDEVPVHAGAAFRPPGLPADRTHAVITTSTGIPAGYHGSEAEAKKAARLSMNYHRHPVYAQHVQALAPVQDAPKHEPAPQVAPDVAGPLAVPVPLDKLPPGHLKMGKSEYPPDVVRLNTFGEEPVTVKGQAIQRPSTAPIFHTHAAVDSGTGEILSTHGGSVGGEVGAAGQARGHMRRTPGRRVHVAPLLQPTEADHAAVDARQKAAQAQMASDHAKWAASPEGKAAANYIKGPEQLKPEVDQKPKLVSQGFHDAVVKFAHDVAAERAEHALSNGYTNQAHARSYTPHVKYGRNYAYVDVGSSGKYMIPHKVPGGRLSHIPVGEVLGLDSAYGVPHPGKRSGNVLAGTAKPSRY